MNSLLVCTYLILDLSVGWSYLSCLSGQYSSGFCGPAKPVLQGDALHRSHHKQPGGGEDGGGAVCSQARLGGDL